MKYNNKMNIKKLSKLRKKIKLNQVAEQIGINQTVLLKRIDRNSPELTEEEAKKIQEYLQNLKKLL